MMTYILCSASLIDCHHHCTRVFLQVPLSFGRFNVLLRLVYIAYVHPEAQPGPYVLKLLELCFGVKVTFIDPRPGVFVASGERKPL